MNIRVGVAKDSGLIHSVVITAANVHDLTPAEELLHDEEQVVYGDLGYQGIAIRPEMAGKVAEFRVAMRPGKRRALPDSLDGRLQDLVEAAKVLIRATGGHPFRAKYHRYHLCSLQETWPGVMGAREDVTHQLGRFLGDHHHCCVLRALIVNDPTCSASQEGQHQILACSIGASRRSSKQANRWANG